MGMRQGRTQQLTGRILPFQKLLVTAILLAGTAAVGLSQTRVLTYYATWQMCHRASRPAGAYWMSVDSIPMQGLTHIVLFAHTDNISTTYPYYTPVYHPVDSLDYLYNNRGNPWAWPPTNWQQYIDAGQYQGYLIQRAHQHGVRVLAIIQSVDARSLNYIVDDSVRTVQFCKAVAGYIQRKGFDGVDVNWESYTAPLHQDKGEIARFFRILRQEVGPTKEIVLTPFIYVYDTLPVAEVNSYVDWINLEAYPWQYAWNYNLNSQSNWHISALHTSGVPAHVAATAIDEYIALWKSRGYHASKLGLLFPSYGTTLIGSTTLYGGWQSERNETHIEEALGWLTRGGVARYDSANQGGYISGTSTASYLGVPQGSRFFCTYPVPKFIDTTVKWGLRNGVTRFGTYYLGYDYVNYRNIVLDAVKNAVSPNPAPFGTFGANPQSVPAGGGMVTLAWTSVNAAQASIAPGVGSVSINGSTSVRVDTSTTFTLTLTGNGGTARFTTRVEVQLPPKAPDAPSLLTPPAGALNQPRTLTVRWARATDNPNRYQYILARDAAFSQIIVNDSSVTDTSRQLASLPASTTLFHKVRARNTSGWGSYCLPSFFTTTGSTGSDEEPEVPSGFRLAHAYPNPFNGVVNISLSLGEATQTSVVIYDPLGNLIATLVDDILPGGSHSLRWNADGTATGTYFVHVRSGSETGLLRLLHVK